MAVVAACGNSLPPESASQDHDPIALSIASDAWNSAQSESNFDLSFLEIERHIPGFGGYFFNKDGSVSIVVKDEHISPLARNTAQALAQHIYDGNASRLLDTQSARDAHIIAGEFSFSELYEALGRIIEDTGDQGILLSDIDEVNNHLRLDVADQQTADRIEQWRLRDGLEASALKVRVTEPPRFFADLKDEVRPVPGGVKISTDRGDCTLGFSVHHNTWGRGFISAAHCTEEQGRVDGDWVAQAGGAWFWADKVGVERVDPSFYPCFVGGVYRQACRTTDGAYFEYDNDSLAELSIAKPATSCSSLHAPCTTTISPYPPDRFPVADPATSTAPVNTTLSKVGSVSGMTNGPVISTCVTLHPESAGFYLTCQGVVEAFATGGDSGAPVVSYSPNGMRPEGLLIGGVFNDDTLEYEGYFFSPIHRVIAELGSMSFN